MNMHPAIRPQLGRPQVTAILSEIKNLIEDAGSTGNAHTAAELVKVHQLVNNHWITARMAADATALALQADELTPADVIGGRSDPPL